MLLKFLTKRNKRTGSCILWLFIRGTIKTEIQRKTGVSFYLILINITSSLILSVKNKGNGGFFTEQTKPVKCHGSYLSIIPYCANQQS